MDPQSGRLCLQIFSSDFQFVDLIDIIQQFLYQICSLLLTIVDSGHLASAFDLATWVNS